ncbi:unnamed protein product, partial [Mesorhabditis spiculigera]
NAFEDFEGQLIQEVLSEHKGGTKDQLLTALRDGMDKHGPEGIQRVYLVHEGAKNATLFGCPKQSCGWKRQDKYLVMSIRYPAIPYKHNNENFQLAAHSLERRMAVLDVMQGNEDYLDVLEVRLAQAGFHLTNQNINAWLIFRGGEGHLTKFTQILEPGE